MAEYSHIEWTDTTWNPVTGCTKVSPGCEHCYAERIVERFKGKGAFTVVVRSEEKLYAPLKWHRPRRVFVNSMSDLFHDDIPASFIARVFSVIARTPQHTYQVLTKRHARMRSILTRPDIRNTIAGIVGAELAWPLPNLWLGVSVEDQKWADIRIPALLDTPAAVRFLSCEPLLSPVDLRRAVATMGSQRGHGLTASWVQAGGCCRRFHGIDWVIVGGESGPGARSLDPAWVRDLADQCRAAEVPVFVKQLGAVWARRHHVHHVDPKGGNWDFWQPDLRVRDYPREVSRHG
jgi:protein gp37